MAKDIHKAPFDEGTKAKLAIFRDYLKEWLPVFLAPSEIYWDTINIFDFFAGPGEDTAANKGTPLLIIDELQPYDDIITSKKLKVNLYFNEYKKEKHDQLCAKINLVGDNKPYKILIYSKDFKASFDELYPLMQNKNAVNLLFLDQNGIRQISEEVFKKILSLKKTDFLFFTSSSTIKRFSEHPAILKHINLTTEEIDRTPYHDIHRLVLNYYKDLIPSTQAYYLSSFSLKKEKGIYGLIFGSGHVLGIEKFLTTCWKSDPERGEANFDIDNDKIIPGQLDIFTEEVRKPKKVNLFESELREAILKRALTTDKDVYLHTVTNSFTPSHARAVIKKLISEKKIEKCKLELSHKICRKGASLTRIKLI